MMREIRWKNQRCSATRLRVGRWSRGQGRVFVLLPLALILCLGGCASKASRMPSTRVDDSIRDEFPVEGRRWAYEAENEVIIALDQRDEAEMALAAATRRVEEAERSRQAANRNGKAQEPARALLSWRQELRRKAAAELSAAEVGVYCARVSFELTKARLAVRFGFPVKENYLEPFESQYEDCAKEQAFAQQSVREAEERAMKALETWRDERRTYVEQTGDHNHGLWID